jgi:inorganic pyrophosphatase
MNFAELIRNGIANNLLGKYERSNAMENTGQEGQVTRAINEIVTLTGEMNKALVQLEERLTPIVLKSERVVGEMKAEKEEEEAKQVLLVEKLKPAGRLLKDMVGRVRQLNARIQL